MLIVCLLGAVKCLAEFTQGCCSLCCALLCMHLLPSVVDLQEYVHKFESEHVKLHMLLGVDHRGLEALGMHSYGHREQLIEGVKEYLRAYLRAAETTTHISAKY